MSIQDISSNFKRFLRGPDLTISALIIGVGIGSFLLGRASVGETLTPRAVTTAKPSATVIETREMIDGTTSPVIQSLVSEQDSQSVTQNGGGYVASKNGTKYHLPWCSGAQRIKEENKIWFKTKEEAEKAGYEPAANCKGI